MAILDTRGLRELLESGVVIGPFSYRKAVSGDNRRTWILSTGVHYIFDGAVQPERLTRVR